MCIDIEIRNVTSDNDHFVRVVIYEVETIDNEEPVRFVRDTYHSNDYPSAVALLPGFLGKDKT